VREDHARRNSDAVKLRRTTAKKKKKKKKEDDDDNDMQVPACLFSVAVLSLCPDRAGIIFSSIRRSPIMCFLHVTVISNMTKLSIRGSTAYGQF
jgi:hypothetical protein